MGVRAACLEALPGTVRERPRLVPQPGAGVVHPLRLAARAGGVRGDRRPRAPDGRLHRAGCGRCGM